MIRTKTICLLLLGFVLFGCSANKDSHLGKVVFARAEFNALVLGKTQEEVQRAVGNPDEVLLSVKGCNGEGWLYSGRTYLPPSKRADGYAVVKFNRAARMMPGVAPFPDEGKIQPASSVEYSDGVIYGN